MCAVHGWPDVSEADADADALALWVYAGNVLFRRASVRRGVGPLFLATGITGKLIIRYEKRTAGRETQSLFVKDLRR